MNTQKISLKQWQKYTTTTSTTIAHFAQYLADVQSHPEAFSDNDHLRAILDIETTAQAFWRQVVVYRDDLYNTLVSTREGADNEQ